MRTQTIAINFVGKVIKNTNSVLLYLIVCNFIRMCSHCFGSFIGKLKDGFLNIVLGLLDFCSMLLVHQGINKYKYFGKSE